MNDLVKLEQLVDIHHKKGNNKKAIKGLLYLVAKYAEKHDLKKAKKMRERIVSIDPMALTEVVQAQEFIDRARAMPAPRGHLEVWEELYDTFTSEESEAFQSELKEASFLPGQTILAQGEKNSNLYFIDAGQAKHIFTQGVREVFIKRVAPGNIANEDSFFDAGLCTNSLVAIDTVKVHFLPAMTLLTWEGYLPAIESKLRDFCATEEKISDLLKKSAQDRRVHQRVNLPGRVLLRIVNAEGEVVGKTIRGDIGDVSVGGISFYIKTASREQAQMLLGRDLQLRFNMPPSMTEIEQIGQVLAVKLHTEAFESREEYSVHIKFGSILAEKSIVEAARFIKMIEITEKNR